MVNGETVGSIAVERSEITRLISGSDGFCRLFLELLRSLV